MGGDGDDVLLHAPVVGGKAVLERLLVVGVLPSQIAQLLGRNSVVRSATCSRSSRILEIGFMFHRHRRNVIKLSQQVLKALRAMYPVALPEALSQNVQVALGQERHGHKAIVSHVGSTGFADASAGPHQLFWRHVPRSGNGDPVRRR